MTRIVAVLIGIMTAWSISTVAAEPKSQLAVGAMKRYDLTLNKLQNDYTAALNKATAQLTNELKQAQAVAMRAGNFDEAMAIAGKLKEMQRSSETSLESRIIKQRWFTFAWRNSKGSGSRRMELLPDGRIGVGSDARSMEQSWHIDDDGNIVFGGGTAYPGRRVALKPIRGDFLDFSGIASTTTITLKAITTSKAAELGQEQNK